jgi:Fe2+ transport system protein B
MKIRVALIGNPNVGKSVIFNNLTGSKQHTGNWPGKTVEMKEGYYTFENNEFEIIDLPGVYSLSAMSEDEEVARQYLIDDRPDVVVDILNASQLERNLYLTLLKKKILESVPTTLLNDKPNQPKEHLPGDINGGDHLHYHPKHHHHGEYERLRPPAIKYNSKIELCLKKIVQLIKNEKDIYDRFPPRWLALRLFEKDESILELVKNPEVKREILEVSL